MSDVDRRILHIDLDAFFISVERVLHPELEGRPVIVGGDPGGRGVVACASYEARACGIHAAMPLKRAARLCPHAVFLRGGFARYREASSRFMAVLADFSPLLEPLGIDEAYLDLTGFEPIYGPVADTAMSIKQRIKDEVGITASIGIGSSKLIAKIASDMDKPDGLVEVAAGDERAFLAPLPVGRLPCVGHKTGEALRRMGVSTVGDLARLSESMLNARFGVTGGVLYRFARGIDRREVTPPQAAKSISRETTFNQDTLDIEFLKATLRYLSERVGADLRRHGRRARCVTLKLRYADFETITRSQTLKESINSDGAIFDAGATMMDRALSQRRQLVRLVGIGVSSLSGEERQLSMLDPAAGREEVLDRAIDRLRQKYGFTAIQRGRTMRLRQAFPADDKGDYTLATPSLSR
jgi:DNA polymerase-4